MEEFIKQLLKDQGVPADLDPKVREQLERDLTDRATDMVNKRIIEAMSDDAVKAFEKQMDEHPEDVAGMQKFIEQHVPDREQVTSMALLEFRALYLGANA